MSRILNETRDRIEAILGAELGTISIARAVVGLFFTGIELSTGEVGACATPLKSIPEAVCCPSSAHAMPFPGKMRGRPAADLLDAARHPEPLRRAIGIATLNALAARCQARSAHPEVELEAGIDAFDAAAIQPGQRVVVVGAFVPFLRELKRRGQPYLVLEQDPATLKPDELPFFREAGLALQVAPEADVLLVTGTTLLNDSLDAILAAARPAARKVVVGPTVGLVADAFLARGADILGAIRVTDPAAFLETLAEGGSGYHFFGRSAEKVVLRRRARPAGDAALARAQPVPA